MANLQENLFDDNYLVETIEIVQLQQENQHQTVESDEFIESDKENSYDDEEYLPPSAKKSKKIKQAKKSQPMKCQSNKFFKPDSKLEIARQVREFPCLWQKKHAFYRNAGKRETAWQRIADSMQLPVSDCKSLWKKTRDTQRYLEKKITKFGKSGEAAEYIDEDGNDTELRDELAFLKDSNSVKLRETVSLGGGALIEYPNASTPSDAESHESTSTTTATTTSLPTSTYSYTMKKAKKAMTDRNVYENDADNTIEAAKKITDSISSLLEQKNQKNELKYLPTWQHIEKLFDQLDENAITDLTFQFITQTYQAVVSKRSQ